MTLALFTPATVGKATLGLILLQSLFCCTDCDGILYLDSGIPGDTVIVTQTAILSGSFCDADNQKTSITGIYQDGTGSVYNMEDNANYQGQSPITGSYGAGSIPSCENGRMHMQGGAGRLSPSIAQDVGATPSSIPDGPEGWTYMSASTEVQYVGGQPVEITESGASVKWSGFGIGISTSDMGLSIPYSDYYYFDPSTALMVFSLSVDGGNSFVQLRVIPDNSPNSQVGTVSAVVPAGTDLSKVVVWVTLDTNDDPNGYLYESMSESVTIESITIN